MNGPYWFILESIPAKIEKTGHTVLNSTEKERVVSKKYCRSKESLSSLSLLISQSLKGGCGRKVHLNQSLEGT